MLHQTLLPVSLANRSVPSPHDAILECYLNWYSPLYVTDLVTKVVRVTLGWVTSLGNKYYLIETFAKLCIITKIFYISFLSAIFSKEQGGKNTCATNFGPIAVISGRIRGVSKPNVKST